jgi:fructose-1,6-bisphosphatase/inositol monophosphatase family enzyme
MLVALVVRHATRMAWLYDPSRGRMAMAEQGAGASLDGVRLASGPAPAFGKMVGQLNLTWYPAETRAAVRAAAEQRFGELTRLYCAGHDFLEQSQGLRHFSFYRRIWPWDHAAGVLIRREAGGTVARIDERPYRAGERVEGLLSAPDPESWQEIRRFLRRAGARAQD